MIKGDVVTLETAFVGARVYSLYHRGAGEIVNILPACSYPILVRLDDTSAKLREYRSDGRMFMSSDEPDLLWGEPEIIAPPRPKRKVMKRFWQGVFESSTSPGKYFTGELYNSRKEAEERCTDAMNYVAVVWFDMEVDA